MSCIAVGQPDDGCNQSAIVMASTEIACGATDIHMESNHSGNNMDNPNNDFTDNSMHDHGGDNPDNICPYDVVMEVMDLGN